MSQSDRARPWTGKDSAVAGIGVRLAECWDRLAKRFNPPLLIVGAWALLCLPLVLLRGYNSDEGLAVTIARSAVEGGHWLEPYVFNVRWVERPTLLSWLIALVSAPFGEVTQLASRLTVALFLLGGCLLIYGLLRGAGARRAAALAAVALFLACPMVLRNAVMITADMPLSVLLFLAFAIWWRGEAAGRHTPVSWIAIGLALALAGLMKGPQPVAYFALGVGVYLLLTSSWRQFPGMILAGLVCFAPIAAWYRMVYTPGDEGQWAAFMRFAPGVRLNGPIHSVAHLAAEILPATIALLMLPFVRRLGGSLNASPRFVLALVCYAFVASVIILFWPGGSTSRYFFPAVLPFCVLGGILYDALAARRPDAAAALLIAPLVLIVYGLIYADIAAPLMPERFRQAALDARAIAKVVSVAPAPIYRTGAVGLNVMPYIPGRIFNGDVEHLATLKGPAWFAVDPAEATILEAARPKYVHGVLSFGEDKEWRLLRLDP
jgi:4-amino-4-deoxy-L-arabinose transferase-like glycosyltransferase